MRYAVKALSVVLAVTIFMSILPRLNAQNGVATERGLVVSGKPIDFDKLVNSLKNSNAKPRIVGGWDVRFSGEYDFGEQRRIHKAVYALHLYAEEAWDPLIQNMDNAEYSVTIEYGEGAHNLTVGQVCEQIIRNTLYVYHDKCADLVDDTNVKMVDLKDAELLDRAQLKSWLSKRQGNSLLKLQAELGANLSKRIASLGLTDEKKKMFSQTVNEHLRHLEENGYAETGNRFIPNRETSWYFSQADATK